MKKIIVCDSGLGGLNIAGAFFREEKRSLEPCELIYFNAYPDAQKGFNKLANAQEQEEVFRDVLEGMKKFSPDLCLIACNTLSIIYERLSRYYRPDFPVKGIMAEAVNGMFNALETFPGSQMLILGTKSTVGSGVYAAGLRAAGIAPERICALPCPGLATLLESDPESADAVSMIRSYAAEAEKIVDKTAPVLCLGLCCTHFEFARKIWEREFSKIFPGKVQIVNPNESMDAPYFAAACRYVSRIELFPGAAEAMAEYFTGNAEPLAAALRNFRADKELFRFDKQ